MRILCVGGGPAGLYFSILMKLQHPAYDVTVLERTRPGSRPGWGVVFWSDLVESLIEGDPETASQILDSAYAWHGQRVELGGRVVGRAGGGFGIGRQRLLEILGSRAVELGVRLEFECEVTPSTSFADADLVVASDGANSVLRERCAAKFGTREVVGRNRYVWLGTTRVFETFTFAFARTVVGCLWMHAYAFSDDCSTCIIECAPDTWEQLCFDRLASAESLALLEGVFAEQLAGHPLLDTEIRERLPWRTFRTVSNRRWFCGSTVLMGDAAHTTHFAIGSGTKLAVEDALALASSLRQHRGLGAALQYYEIHRKGALRVPRRQARNSARWFEDVDRAPVDPRLFAYLLYRRRSAVLTLLPRALQRAACSAHEVTVLRLLWRGFRGLGQLWGSGKRRGGRAR